MGKKASRKKNAKPASDSRIDFSDIPELSDEQLGAMKRLGRPLLGDTPRKPIAVRIDSTVLLSIRQEAKEKGIGYQTLINEILAKHVRKRSG